MLWCYWKLQCFCAAICRRKSTGHSVFKCWNYAPTASKVQECVSSHSLVYCAFVAESSGLKHVCKTRVYVCTSLCFICRERHVPEKFHFEITPAESVVWLKSAVEQYCQHKPTSLKLVLHPFYEVRMYSNMQCCC